jgi:hypothetical protein
MTTAGELRSGKGHRDENFPVASWLIDARHRGIILAFYEFVRIADDIADHAIGWSKICSATARTIVKRCACVARLPSAACRRATRRTCSPHSAWT